MGALIPIVLGLLAVGGIVYGISLWTAHRRRLWGVAARHLGLEVVQGGFLTSDSIEGEIDGMDVKLDTFTRNHGKSSTTYTRVVVQGGIPADLTLKSEGLGTSFKKLFTGEDVQIEDAPFDEEILIEGPEMVAVATLGAGARSQVVALARAGGRVENGTVYWEKRGVMDKPHEIVDRIRSLVQVAKSVSVSGSSPAERLAHNVAHDPKPQVRERNLEMLLRHFADTAEAGRALESAARDPHPGVRLEAATHRGRQGLPLLLSLASRSTANRSIRSRALRALHLHIGDDGAVRAILGALAGEDRDTLRAALWVVEQTGLEEAIVPVLELAPLAAHDPHIGAPIANALGAIGEPSAEPVLLEMLASLDEVEVQRAAAHALATCGTLAAVETLLEHTEGFFTDGELKKTARASIAAIQAARAGADAGQLSLSTPNQADGALSIAEDPGALSLAEPEVE